MAEMLVLMSYISICSHVQVDGSDLRITALNTQGIMQWYILVARTQGKQWLSKERLCIWHIMSIIMIDDKHCMI